MIESEFIPFNEALALKQLGFDEECLAFYSDIHNTIPILVDDDQQYKVSGYRTCKNSMIPDNYIAAPTFQSSFKWFRDKYDLYAVVWKYYQGGYYIETETGGSIATLYPTYEEAELACLRKLIELANK